MHRYVSEQEFIEQIAGGLGWYYLGAALVNAIAAGWALRALRHDRQQSAPRTILLVTAAGSLIFLVLGSLAFAGYAAALSLPQGLRDAADRALGPMAVGVGSLAVLSLLFWLRRIFARPPIAWLLLNAALVLLGLSLTDADFAAIVTKPDNVAIVGMIFLLGYFTWLSAYKAVQNDERRSRGEKPLEALDDETVLVWPDLVYIELICMVVLSAGLIFWALAIQAPLEEPASSVKTPNPSKAPWYFVGLQEMLYYFDPWMAGVVLPVLIIVGLMAIPYLDRNPRGNGYYTIDERKFEYLTFQFGFLLLWILLILIGTFFRGPNWAFFGVYEPWDVHKVESQHNVNLSQYFWMDWLGIQLPRSADAASTVGRLGRILLRELPGIVLLGAYFLLLPIGLARWTAFFRRVYRKLGPTRYVILLLLLLVMLLLPLKMMARWTGNLQYLVAIPEYALNL